MNMFKEILGHLVVFFFFVQSVLAGFHGEYTKGCYFMMWLFAGVNFVASFYDD